MRKIIFLLIIFSCILPAGFCLAQLDGSYLKSISDFTCSDDITIMHLLASRASNIAMDRLPFDKGDPDALVLTNAGRVTTIGNHSTEQCIDAVIATTGCSIGRKNLILIQGTNEPLWFAFCRKDTKNCVYIVVNSTVNIDSTIQEFALVPDESLFKISKHNIDVDRLFESPSQWDLIEEDLGESNAFSVATLTNALDMDPPASLIACLRSHNKITPELISGYILAEYARKELPVENPRDQEYIVVSLHGSAQDDAIMTLLDATPGRSGLFIRHSEQLPAEFRNASSIFILWNARMKRGEGMVLAFDTEKVIELSDADRENEPLHRLKIIMWEINHLNDTELFVSPIKTFRINNQQLIKLKEKNPVAELDELPRAIPYRPTTKYMDLTGRNLPPCNINIELEKKTVHWIRYLLIKLGVVTRITDRCPYLKPVSDFVGEENLTILHLLAFRASDIAMDQLHFDKGDPDVLAFTDAGYVVNIDGYSTEQCIDSITATTGCTAGRNNLLLIHRSADMPLWFMFSRKDTKDFIYFSIRKQKLKQYLDIEHEYGYNTTLLTEFMKEPPEAIFRTIVKHNIGTDALSANTSSWDNIINDISTINAMGVATTTNVLACDVPSRLASCAEFHTRICPGTLCGYLISEHIKEELPITGEAERYIVIPMSITCKDDALITLLGMFSWELFARELPLEQEEALLPENETIPGIAMLRDMNFTEEQIDLLLREGHLFNWSNVPGNDSERLIRFLADDLGIDWAENAKIRKINDGRAIRILGDGESARITIDEGKEKAILKIRGGRAYNLTVRKWNGSLNIYTEEKKRYSATIDTGFSRIAGLFIKWNETTDTGEGIAVTIDMKKINGMSGVNYTRGPWWLRRLPEGSDISKTPFANRNDPGWKWRTEKSAWMADHLDELGKYVKTVKRFKLNNSEELSGLISDDADPLVKVGILNQSE